MIKYMSRYYSIKNKGYSLDFQAIALELKNEIIDRPHEVSVKFLFLTILIVAVATLLSYFTLFPVVYNSNQNNIF
jgi:hypothetical protein